MLSPHLLCFLLVILVILVISPGCISASLTSTFCEVHHDPGYLNNTFYKYIY